MDLPSKVMEEWCNDYTSYIAIRKVQVMPSWEERTLVDILKCFLPLQKLKLTRRTGIWNLCLRHWKLGTWRGQQLHSLTNAYTWRVSAVFQMSSLITTAVALPMTCGAVSQTLHEVILHDSCSHAAMNQQAISTDNPMPYAFHVAASSPEMTLLHNSFWEQSSGWRVNQSTAVEKNKVRFNNQRLCSDGGNSFSGCFVSV